jgi:Gpi18-like mannosyltransferase
MNRIVAWLKTIARKLTSKSTVRNVFFLWLAWVFIMIGFQALASARLRPERPDRVQEWTVKETTATAQNDKPYLIDPFLNDQVSWDSEFYLSIALAGYDDPLVRQVPNTDLSLNYAFMPFYPHVIRLVAWPLRVLGLTPIATGSLAGVIVSTLGTLAAMLSLYDLAREELGDAGGIRAAFYLIVFPSGFFLAQVYTEGLFVGLAFTCLAMARRRKLVLAALLAALATWTKAAGAALIIPLAIPWIRDGDWMELDMEWKQLYFKGIPWKSLWKALISLAPLIAFVVWKFSYWGTAFNRVEELFFGRGFLSLGVSYYTWRQAFWSLFGPNPQTAAYYAVEFGAIVLGIVACFATWKRYPGLSAYGLAVVLLSLTSGPAQGMHRYVLGAPSVFLFLSRLGKNPTFDRAWSIISTLIMGLFAMMFTYDMWAG